MIDISNKSPIVFIKGFSKNANSIVPVDPNTYDGNFYAIITDLEVSTSVQVVSAVPLDGKWLIEFPDGKTSVLKQAPDKIRQLKLVKIIQTTDSSGSKVYRLRGYLGNQEIITSTLVKFWIDSNGMNHCLTASGSHYMF